MAGPLRLRLGIAHFHHGLRGATADRDAGLVAHQALAAGLPFFYARGDAAAHRRRHRLSLEEASRELRYTFFETTARRYGFGCVALGHHADDNAELVLMRLLRGSGPLGLAGIPPVRVLGSTNLKVIRPLIDIERAAIERFRRRHGMATAEDDPRRWPQKKRGERQRRVRPPRVDHFISALPFPARTAPPQGVAESQCRLRHSRRSLP